jgi:hypothetical protein
MTATEKVLASLSSPFRSAYLRAAEAPLRQPEVLAQEVEAYVQLLEQHAEQVEFMDLATASRVAEICRFLLAKLEESPCPDRHLAVQAAVEYFILEDDGEDDTSLIGFDDDLQVAQVTAAVLGWDIPDPPL